VLDVGDSHTLFTKKLWGYPDGWDVDAEGGRASDEAVRALQQDLRPRDDEVVFDIATNDAKQPEVLRRNLARVWSAIGHRELTLVTFYNYCCPGAHTDVNRVITDFEARHPARVTIARWGKIAARHPHWWGTDGIHYATVGYHHRKHIVARAVAK
jgi:hypothetical protein